MRFKKQIIIICLFTFLFIPFNPSQKPKAEVLTLTSGAIIACAALATAAGVIITNPDMLQDVGSRVFEGIKNIDGAISSVGDKFVINVIPSVISKVFDVLFSLPESDYYVDKTITENFSLTTGDNILFTFDIGDIDLHRTYNFTFDFETNPDLVIGLRNQSGQNVLSTSLINCTESNPSIEMILNYVSIAYYGYINYNDRQVATKKLPTSIYSLFVNSNVKGSLEADYDKSICIPYTPLNSESVSEDKPKEYFPSGSGSISIPNDRPIGGFNPSIDKPITKPGDLLQEGDLVADKDDVISPPKDDVGDVPSTGESLWDTLLSWLKTLFMPLINLLTSILNFLTTMIESLISAISSLLEGLFVPSLSIDDLFVIPNGSGFSNIISLFDWNIFDITPRPYEFSTTLPFTSLVDGTSNPQTIEINIFENEVVKKYLPIVRNVLSYSLLISTIFIIVWHFLPKRDID